MWVVQAPLLLTAPASAGVVAYKEAVIERPRHAGRWMDAVQDHRCRIGPDLPTLIAGSSRAVPDRTGRAAGGPQVQRPHHHCRLGARGAVAGRDCLERYRRWWGQDHGRPCRVSE